MNLSKVLFIGIIVLSQLLFIQCAGTSSHVLGQNEASATPSKTAKSGASLPAQMPDDLEITYKTEGGFAPRKRQIKISGDKIMVEEMSGNEKTPNAWSAALTKEDKEKLYRVFVDNKVEALHSDGPRAVPPDGIEYVLTLNFGGNTIVASTYSGEQVSGDMSKRFETVFSSINNLAAKYEDKAGDPTQKFAVLLYDSAVHNWIFKNATASSLSGAEISTIQGLVGKAIDEENGKQSSAKKIDLSKYKFQFLPVVTEDKNKQVWVNGFCHSLGARWRNEVIVVDDGGNCFFNLKVNLTNNTVYDLMVNGDA